MLRIDPSKISATDLQAVLEEVLDAVEVALNRKDDLRQEETTARANFETELRLALSESRDKNARAEDQQPDERS